MVLTIKHGVWECDEFVGGKKKKEEGVEKEEEQRVLLYVMCSASNVR